MTVCGSCCGSRLALGEYRQFGDEKLQAPLRTKQNKENKSPTPTRISYSRAVVMSQTTKSHPTNNI